MNPWRYRGKPVGQLFYKLEKSCGRRRTVRYHIARRTIQIPVNSRNDYSNRRNLKFELDLPVRFGDSFPVNNVNAL